MSRWSAGSKPCVQQACAREREIGSGTCRSPRPDVTCKPHVPAVVQMTGFLSTALRQQQIHYVFLAKASDFLSCQYFIYYSRPNIVYQNTLQISYIDHRNVVVIEFVCLTFRVCRTSSELKSVKSSSVVFMVVVKC